MKIVADLEQDDSEHRRHGRTRRMRVLIAVVLLLPFVLVWLLDALLALPISPASQWTLKLWDRLPVALTGGRDVVVAGPLLASAFIAALVWASLAAFVLSSAPALVIGLAATLAAVCTSAVLLLAFRIWIPPALLTLGVLAAYALSNLLRLRTVVDFLHTQIDFLNWIANDEFKADHRGSVSREPIGHGIEALDQAISRVARDRTLLSEGFEQMPIAMLMCRADGAIVQANLEAIALLDPSMLDAKALIGAHLLTLIAHLSIDANEIGQKVAELHWSEGFDREYRTQVGRSFKVDTGMFDEGGSLLTKVWFVVLVELTLERRGQQAHSEWLRLLSHDMRSPQVNLLSMVELYGMKRLTIEDLLAGVRREAQRTLELAEGFIDGAKAKADASDFFLVSVAAVLGDAVEQALAYAATRRVTLLLQFTEEDYASIWTDRPMLVRAIVNLLENAAQHSGPLSTVHLCASVNQSDEIIVMIRDEGRGMTPEQLASLLDASSPSLAHMTNESESRARRGVSGTSRHGLGFPSVRRAVDAHHGWIMGWSAPESGTTFVIGLPLEVA